MDNKFMPCTSCGTAIPGDSVFCFECGVRQRCSDCGEEISKNSKFCSNCGKAVAAAIGSTEKNTVKYHRTRDEITCELSLSDTVATDGIKSMIENLTRSQTTEFKNLEFKENAREYDNPTEDVEVVHETHEEKNVRTFTQPNDSKMPHIEDLENTKELSEPNWILAYAFYESDFGKKEFTREKVLEKYSAKRKTNQRMKNFSGSWKNLFKEYIATVKEGVYRIKPNAETKIRELLIGTRSSSPRKSLGRVAKNIATSSDSEDKKPKKGAAGRVKGTTGSLAYKIDENLNLLPKGKETFMAFYKKYEAKNVPAQILIMTYYLEKIALVKNINENMLYTCYKEAKALVPNISTALKNIGRRQRWINTSDHNNLTVSLSGENTLEHKMKKK
jgi:hypothetical protein